jgi:glycosyltransferase involved in cell wall biosynthesis
MIRNLVSIIIPVFNAETTLSRAIESVLRQTYSDFEIIVVDDGSTDGSAEIIRGFSAHVRYERQANHGPAAARNRGLAMVRGEFIAFLDADDEWLPARLERTVAPLRADSAVGLCYCRALQVASDGSRRRHNPSDIHKRFPSAIAPPRHLCTPAATIRRACIDQCGGFDETFPASAERDFFVRIAENYGVREVREELVLVHASSTSLRNRVRVEEKVEMMFRWTFKALLRQPLGRDRDSALAAAFAMASAKYANAGQRLKAIKYSLGAFVLHPGLGSTARVVRSVLPWPRAGWRQRADS